MPADAVLITSAGRRVELLECFRRGASAINLPIRVLACDADPSTSSACHKADASFLVPRCAHESYVPALLELCSRWNVRLIVPTIDTELQILADAKEHFKRIGVEVAVSSSEIVRLARDKRETMSLFESLGLPTPRTFFQREPEAAEFPVITKPIDGSASAEVQVFRSREQFNAARLDIDRFLVQELCVGAEYTVNLFFDQSGLRCAVPHLRMETRGGEVSKGITVRHEVLLALAERLGGFLAGKAFGALCFQAIDTANRGVCLLELNARFGGGYPLADHAGAPFAQWLLELAFGQPCSAQSGWREKVQMLRYDTSVFLEGAS